MIPEYEHAETDVTLLRQRFSNLPDPCHSSFRINYTVQQRNDLWEFQ